MYSSVISIYSLNMSPLFFSYTGVEVPERGIFTFAIAVTAIMRKLDIDYCGIILISLSQ